MGKTEYCGGDSLERSSDLWSRNTTSLKRPPSEETKRINSSFTFFFCPYLPGHPNTQLIDGIAFRAELWVDKVGE